MLCIVHADAQWSPIPINITNQFSDRIMAICADSAGNIYAGTEFSTVFKWDGTTWIQLPHPYSGTNYGSGLKAMVTDRAGNLYVAGDISINVAKWDGTQWTLLGGVSNNLQAASITCMTIDSTGNIYAAGNNSLNNSNADFVAEWNGTQWAYLSANWYPLGYTSSGITSIAVDHGGNVYVAGQGPNASGKAYLEKWDGNAWNSLGDTLLDAAWMIDPQVKLTDAGDIYWSGTYMHSGGNVQDSSFVLKWNGTVWKRMKWGTLDFVPGFMGQLITDTSGSVYVSGLDAFKRAAYAFKWDGTTVTKLGDSISTPTYPIILYSGYPGLVLSHHKLYTTSLGSTYYSSYGSFGHSYYVARLQLPCITAAQKICMVTTDTVTNKNKVIWEKADKYGTDSFYIYRDGMRMAAIGRDSLSEWEDTTSYPAWGSYRYTITTRDTCGILGYMSPYHASLSFSPMEFWDSSATPPHGYYAGFYWTPYYIEGDTSAVGVYQIYIDSFSTGNWHVLATVNPALGGYYYDSTLFALSQASFRMVIQTNRTCNPSRNAGYIYSNIVTSDFPTGISSIDDLNDVKIYPNPAKDLLNIGFTNSDRSSQKITLNIVNAIGQSMYNAALSPTGTVKRIDMADWPGGIYFVTISKNGKWLSRKVVKY